MSQRFTASAATASGEGSSNGAEGEQRQYPEVNPLMPHSLRMVPPWYENTHFRHNLRLLVGMVPGAVLLLTVTGTT